MRHGPPSVVARWLAAGDSGDVEAFDDLLRREVMGPRTAGEPHVTCGGRALNDDVMDTIRQDLP